MEDKVKLSEQELLQVSGGSTEGTGGSTEETTQQMVDMCLERKKSECKKDSKCYWDWGPIYGWDCYPA